MLFNKIRDIFDIKIGKAFKSTIILIKTIFIVMCYVTFPITNDFKIIKLSLLLNFNVNL